ncbi:hypothetical protein [Streptomyces sp. SP2-10]|uniref:hypothetical protein n=1 Tax=Streptomyces sp. SP2-10 TaxID=2873385 RepID=UPI001CA6E977|nr:hypothetical protein [Streptomyces sp. SP2-10]MBY8844437.1 hypothetical protein [Streptomyces sp. SP2-10]
MGDTVHPGEDDGTDGFPGERELPPVVLGYAAMRSGPARRPRIVRAWWVRALAAACAAVTCLLCVVLLPHGTDTRREISAGPTPPPGPTGLTPSRLGESARHTPSRRTGGPPARRTGGPTAPVHGGRPPGTGTGTGTGEPSGGTGRSSGGGSPARSGTPPTVRASTKAGPRNDEGDGPSGHAVVVFTDPAADGTAYVPVPHCPLFHGTALVPSGYRLWFAAKYNGEPRYALHGPPDALTRGPGGRSAWTKRIVLGNDSQFLRGTVIAVLVPADWADYLLTAYDFDGTPVVVPHGAVVSGFTTAGLPPRSRAVGALKVRRAEGSRPCSAS